MAGAAAHSIRRMGETLSGEMGSPKMNYVLRPTRVMSHPVRRGEESQVCSVLLAWEAIALRVKKM